MICPLPHSLALCQAVFGVDLCAASDASPAPLSDSLLASTYLTSLSFLLLAGLPSPASFQIDPNMWLSAEVLPSSVFLPLSTSSLLPG